MNTIKRIVLTGGPCAGKTTALVKVIEHFTSLGYKVFTIPEVPTMFTQAGMNYLTSNKAFFFEGEKATLQTQLHLEDCFYKMAQTLEQPVLIVCDRGVMDISAYLTSEDWQKIIGEVGCTQTQLRDERYDAVLHLVLPQMERSSFILQPITPRDSNRQTRRDFKSHVSWIRRSLRLGQVILTCVSSTTMRTSTTS